MAGTQRHRSVRFSPELPAIRRWLDRLEMGAVVRIVLRFADDFWETAGLPRGLAEDHGRNFGFVHGREHFFPVWWSAVPCAVLIGWCGGPAARELSSRSREQVVGIALHSLARILTTDTPRLLARLPQSRKVVAVVPNRVR